ncbi:hypothetical protein OAA24_00310 [bacterium]|nr:hypothetical protein [bacterium]
MQKINKTYNLQNIQIEINYLISKYGWWNDTQISLQSPNGDWHDGVGKSSGQNFTETDFNSINTEDHWEITRFIKENNLYRTRILKLFPYKCYSYHKDWSPRVHLAVNTHPHCFIVEEKELIHIPADSHPYLVDTTKAHTALNGSTDVERIHIVGCIKKETT